MEFITETLLELMQTQSVDGACVMVSNTREMWQLASNDSQKPIIYVCWGGEDPWSSNANISAVTHRVNRSWILGVKQGRGFKSNRGESLKGFIPFVEQVRDTMRSMLGISEDFGNDYSGIKPWSQGSLVIDGYLITFGTKNDLPNILLTPD